MGKNSHLIIYEEKLHFFFTSLRELDFLRNFDTISSLKYIFFMYAFRLLLRVIIGYHLKG